MAAQSGGAPAGDGGAAENAADWLASVDEDTTLAARIAEAARVLDVIHVEADNVERIH